MMSRLRRSELATPGDSERRIASAARSDADLVFLDLEDAVAPAAKADARALTAQAITGQDWGAKVLAVRVNGVEDHNCYQDVIDVVTAGRDRLDLVMVPKVKSAADVIWFDRLLTQIEGSLGIDRRIGLEVLIEEVEALVNVDEIAASTPRLEALIFGFGDYSASQGIKREQLSTYPGDAWNYHRNRMIIAARANGLDAIDGPYGNFKDLDGFEEEARRASTLGANGKWAIHPSQIAIANEVYSPTEEAVAVAQRMVDGYEEAERQGLGAAQVDGRLVDAASMRIYRPILELDAAIRARKASA